MNSTFLNLNSNDFFKGLLIAVLTAVLTAVYTALDGGSAFDWKTIITVGITSGIAYLLKNFSSNSDGKILNKEQPTE